MAGGKLQAVIKKLLKILIAFLLSRHSSSNRSNSSRALKYLAEGEERKADV